MIGKLISTKYTTMSQNRAAEWMRDLLKDHTNVKGSITHIGAIYPELNRETALKEAVETHSNIFTNYNFESSLFIIRKWQSIDKNTHNWTREEIKRKLDTNSNTKQNQTTKEMVIQIFDNIIMFDALTYKIQELYGPSYKNGDMNSRINMINFASKNREYFINNLSILVQNKYVFNIVCEILDT